MLYDCHFETDRFSHHTALCVHLRRVCFPPPAGSYFFKQSQEHGARMVVKADKQLRADEKRARKREYIAWEERGGDKLGPFVWNSTIREQLTELLVHKFDLKYGNKHKKAEVEKAEVAMACVRAEVKKFVKGTIGLKGGLTVDALSGLERTIKKRVEDGDSSANGGGWCCTASSAAMKEGGPSLMAAMNESLAAIEVNSGDDDDDDDDDENGGDDDGGGGGGGGRMDSDGGEKGETAVKTLTAEEVVQMPQLWALDLAKDKHVGVSRMARRDAYVLCGVEVLTAEELVEQAKRDAANAVDTWHERVMLKIDEALSPIM